MVDLMLSHDVVPESERRFRTAFDQASIGMVLIDRAGKLTYVNRSMCRIAGCEEHELLGTPYVNVLRPEDRPGSLDLFQRVLAGEGKGYVNERQLLRRDGEMVWVRSNVLVDRDEQGLAQVVVLVEDITESKEAEEALRTSEERFRIAAENGSDTIYEWDLKTGEVDVFGLVRDRLGDRPMPRAFEEWKSIVHPEDIEKELAGIQRTMSTGGRHSGEYRILGESGRMYHYANRGQVIRNAAGEPRKWVGLVTDISESKLAGEAISQLAAIVQYSDEAIVGTNLAGQITTWNAGAQKLLGYAAAEVLGKPIAILVPTPNRELDIEKLLARIEQGEVSRIDETGLCRKDGSRVPVSLTFSPIHKANGEVLGVALFAHDITERKVAENKLEYQARHDLLTGLPNRSLLTHRLADLIEKARRAGRMAGVIFIDLDGFKFVNDTLGHETGDILLQQVSERLNLCKRAGDTLARMGGDEFMLIAQDVPEAKIALEIAERLTAILKEPFHVADRALHISASIGISMYPRDGSDVSTLQRNADTAMYDAKRSGKDRIRFFTPEMAACAAERLELESDLRLALERKELALHYQPIFDICECRVTALEALVRWKHPARGPLPPNKFIPMAEETGLIIRLGAWVLHEACLQAQAWQARGLAGSRVAVNVSALEFARPDFVEHVCGTLDITGLRGDLLELELTETVLAHDLDDTRMKMSQLHARGIRIAIDDFGTGYSSLGYLARLPIDALKIDRSFVAEIETSKTAVSLIRGMVTLGHSIGKRVVVEGVETMAQLEVIRQIGCKEVQGYLLGRPAILDLSNQEQIQGITAGSWPADVSPDFWDSLNALACNTDVAETESLEAAPV